MRPDSPGKWVAVLNLESRYQVVEVAFNPNYYSLQGFGVYSSHSSLDRAIDQFVFNIGKPLYWVGKVVTPKSVEVYLVEMPIHSDYDHRCDDEGCPCNETQAVRVVKYDDIKEYLKNA